MAHLPRRAIVVLHYARDEDSAAHVLNGRLHSAGRWPGSQHLRPAHGYGTQLGRSAAVSRRRFTELRGVCSSATRSATTSRSAFPLRGWRPVSGGAVASLVSLGTAA